MGSSIQEMYDKFKSFLADDTFYYSMVVILVAVIAFGIGRWSASYTHQTSPIPYVRTVQTTQKASVIDANGSKTFENAASSTLNSQDGKPAIDTTDTTIHKYVASKSGTKYHLLTCPGAKQIKEENKIYFSSKEEAQKAGYTPASNCKGI